VESPSKAVQNDTLLASSLKIDQSRPIQANQQWSQHNLSFSKTPKPIAKHRVSSQQSFPIDVFGQTVQQLKAIPHIIHREVFGRGEKAVGSKTKTKPKTITFTNDDELCDKLWEHFYHGQGQPVEIDLSKLDFSDDINLPKLLFGDKKFLLNRLRQQPSKDATKRRLKRNHYQSLF